MNSALCLCLLHDGHCVGYDNKSTGYKEVIGKTKGLDEEEETDD